MTTQETNLFQKALRNMEKGNSVAEQLLEKIETSYNQSGLIGVESLISQIREKYVEGLNEAKKD